MTAAASLLTLALAGILLWAGGIKVIVARDEFRMAIKSWGVPAHVVTPLAWGIPAWELTVGGLAGVGVLNGRASEPSAWLLSGTFAAFLAFQMGVGLRRPAANCGCFGRPAPISRTTMARTAILFGTAVVAALSLTTFGG